MSYPTVRELLHKIMTLNETRDVETLEALLDQEADRLNMSLFQGQDSHRAFAVHTNDEFNAAVDLKSRSQWHGRVCIFATGQTRSNIERFANLGCGITAFRPSNNTVCDQFPSTYLHLFIQRKAAEDYHATISEITEHQNVRIKTVAEMETLIRVLNDAPNTWIFQIRIIANNPQVAATLREMAEGQGIRIAPRGN